MARDSEWNKEKKIIRSAETNTSNKKGKKGEKLHKYITGSYIQAGKKNHVPLA